MSGRTPGEAIFPAALLPRIYAGARQGIAVYSAFLRNSFLVMLAYRLRYYTGICSYLLFVAAHYFIWQAVFAGHPAGARIHGFTLAEMTTYVSVGWIARSLYFSNIDYDVDELVRSGQISTFLIRPIQFHAVMIVQGAGEALFRLLFFTVPIGAVILLLFPVSAPAGTAAFCLFCLSTALGFLILAEVSFLVGTLSFRLKSIQGIIRSKYFLIQVLSGLLLPPPFFPAWFQPVIDALPFKHVAYVPLQLYLGQISTAQAWEPLCSQVLWAAACAVLAEYALRRSFAHLAVQGG
ncbi:MAG TPA: ABC-2 family transporter protein [Oligoflexia bacterium]|nr:ABC-2 family transporter protein [Oligoflexia bacterium]